MSGLAGFRREGWQGLVRSPKIPRLAVKYFLILTTRAYFKDKHVGEALSIGLSGIHMRPVLRAQ